MRPIVRHQGRVRLYEGDSREVLKGFADNSLDSVVCDPPYALVSVIQRFGGDNAAPAKFGTDGLYARASAGFMGQKWDTGETAFAETFWREVLRVLKPGGHVVAFGGTRTYHHLAMAVELAGFDIRDQLAWVYGTGFPKNHPQVDGQGTALKPAWEPIVLAQKPFKGSIAANIAEWGTGGLQIDGCRVPFDGAAPRGSGNSKTGTSTFGDFTGNGGNTTPEAGRFPANLLHDGSPEVLEHFPITAGQKSALQGSGKSKSGEVYAAPLGDVLDFEKRGDTGSAARFFYSAKASKADREEGCEHLPIPEGKSRRNFHPTVKPTEVMRWLVRLVTPPGGVVLDPFMGSGSTGKAALMEGRQFIGIDAQPEFIPIAEARIAFAAKSAPAPVPEPVKELEYDGY